jgi:DNA (cytosine-5)-methyltransferase 1
MPDKGNFGAVLQPTAYRWQNDDLGLQQDDAVAALRASAGSSGFHEMNHPVIAQPVPFTKAKRAQSVTDDETWVQGQVNPTLSLFDQGDTRATTVAVSVDLQNVNLAGDVAGTLDTTRPSRGSGQAVAFSDTSSTLKGGSGERGYPDPSDGNGHSMVGTAMTVRRLTPVECERLQGFPDNWTAIPWRKKPAEECPDGPRYKALGNSMACNCMAWIGEKIAKWEADHA